MRLATVRYHCLVRYSAFLLTKDTHFHQILMINKLLVIKRLQRLASALGPAENSNRKSQFLFFISTKFIINNFNRFINDIYDLTRMILILTNFELPFHSDGGTFFYPRQTVRYRNCPNSRLPHFKSCLKTLADKG